MASKTVCQLFCEDLYHILDFLTGEQVKEFMIIVNRYSDTYGEELIETDDKTVQFAVSLILGKIDARLESSRNRAKSREGKTKNSTEEQGQEADKPPAYEAPEGINTKLYTPPSDSWNRYIKCGGRNYPTTVKDYQKKNFEIQKELNKIYSTFPAEEVDKTMEYISRGETVNEKGEVYKLTTQVLNAFMLNGGVNAIKKNGSSYMTDCLQRDYTAADIEYDESRYNDFWDD